LNGDADHAAAAIGAARCYRRASRALGLWERAEDPMSVAFTKEQDSEAAAADLPDRPISPHRNLVTPEGLAALEAALAEARAAYAAAQASGDVGADRTAMARATRDLRYYSARRASAELVEPTREPDTVVFGATVAFERDDGRRQSFRIVGEDEADPTAGSVSHVSPLARALMGKGVGDTAVVAGQAVEILAIS
jgi:transcription elongation GreA/GreB family factor